MLRPLSEGAEGAEVRCERWWVIGSPFVFVLVFFFLEGKERLGVLVL